MATSLTLKPSWSMLGRGHNSGANGTHAALVMRRYSKPQSLVTLLVSYDHS
jgi:hypothetical protein